MSSPGKQGRCAECKNFLHRWNDHKLCVRCQLKQGVCDPTDTCEVCFGWADDKWSLYLNAVKETRDKEHQRQVRRSLSFERPSPAKSAPPMFGSHGFPTGTHGFSTGPYGYPAGFPGWPSSQPLGPPPTANPEWLRGYYLQQLQSLPPAPPQDLTTAAFQQGMLDAEKLSLPRKSRKGSMDSRGSSLFKDFIPLDK